MVETWEKYGSWKKQIYTGNNIEVTFVATAWENLEWIYLDQDKGHVLCSSEYANETLGSTGWVELLN